MFCHLSNNGEVSLSKPRNLKQLIAGSPPISLSLIVGKGKCDAQASVTPQLFFFFDCVGLYNTSF